MLDPDVLPDRDLGPRAAHLRRREVLPLHVRRQRADAGRVPRPATRRAGARARSTIPAARRGRPSTRRCRCGCFLACALAFAIKVPMFPFHTWLPDAHVEAPTAGSVILAGVLLKMGDVRLPALRDPAVPGRGACASRRSIGVLAVIGIVYGALVSLVQPDLKKLVAYSSVSHLGFVDARASPRSSTMGVVGLRLPDAEPRHLDRRALLPRRHALRPPAHAADLRVRRAARRSMPWYFAVVPADQPLVDRGARLQRLRRRVPDPDGVVGLQPLAGGLRLRSASILAAGLRAVDGEARLLRRGRRTRRTQGLPDLSFREALRARAARRARALHGRREPAVHAADRARGRRARAAGAAQHADRTRAAGSAPPRACRPLPPQAGRPLPRRSRRCSGERRSRPATDPPGGHRRVTGLVVLLAQAFAPKGRRAPLVAALGRRPRRRARVRRPARDRRRPRRGARRRARRRRLLALLPRADPRRAPWSRCSLSPSYLRDERPRARRVLRAHAVLGRRHARPRLEPRARLDLRRARDHVDRALRARRACGAARVESQESALKYFVTGSFSSAFFLYGVALALRRHRQHRARAGRPRARDLGPGDDARSRCSARRCCSSASRFKVASVPFHMWAPDVYEGAPTPVTGVHGRGREGGGLRRAAARVRLRAALAGARTGSRSSASLAVVTMVVGNLAALAQAQPQAHARVLVDRARRLPADGARRRARPRGRGDALLPRRLRGGEPRRLRRRSRRSRATAASRSRSADLAGLAERRPALAAALTVFLVSLTGIPVTAGFVGKFYLFNAAVAAGWVWLAIVGVVMSVVSAYYYLRRGRRDVHARARRRGPRGRRSRRPPRSRSPSRPAVTLVLGVWPAPLLALARVAARSLLSSF